ncbi:hypothetical protein ETT51_08240 [Streptococcus pyogenes]|nr:hypothetical protein F8173_06820 [Streptococcus pyogenes]PWO32108.1 hypothetical protein DJ560_05130 [Streptococcus pyogenes]QCK31285.1 hypothetical protein ETT70_08020 [Streptococcus pyogenes]QCK41466.1 hypothetical protein ETT64_07965 [Streptococcus pyogenes]QCK63447.1 hypothetical protein ETT51_08240 [Streptococcus pyogenes]
MFRNGIKKGIKSKKRQKKHLARDLQNACNR